MDRHAAERAESFHFSRMVEADEPSQLDPATLERIARRMTRQGDAPGGSSIPAGYTYFGQFVAHDLSFDRTVGELEESFTVEELEQARSPALDLDSLYDDGPERAGRFYADGGPELLTGTTTPVAHVPELPGYDLPRGDSGTDAERRQAVIPDIRNDDNLAVAQLHAAFIRLHNRVVATQTDPGATGQQRFEAARRLVTLHFQWLVWNDYLPRICDRAVLDAVWKEGRKAFEPLAGRDEVPTMPVEFAVAAFRLGHSMVRSTYTWNVHVELQLMDLFQNAARGGDLGGATRLRSTRVADLRRLFRFHNLDDDRLEPVKPNIARRIDTRLSPELRALPSGTFDGGTEVTEIEQNLAFRNLMKARRIGLASGQAMAERLAPHGVTPLDDAQLAGAAAELDPLGGALGTLGMRETPLWVYVLCEAEHNDGKLRGVGARIVAETFHRAIQGSRTSLLEEPAWQPTLGVGDRRYRLADLLLWAFEGDVTALAPLEAHEAGLL